MAEFNADYFTQIKSALQQSKQDITVGNSVILMGRAEGCDFVTSQNFVVQQAALRSFHDTHSLELNRTFSV